MTIHAPYVAIPLRHTATAIPDCFRPVLSASVDIYGSAQPTAPMQRRDAMQRLAFQKRDLTHRAAKARNLRQMSKAASFEAQLRGVIREILAMGPQPNGERNEMRKGTE